MLKNFIKKKEEFNCIFNFDKMDFRDDINLKKTKEVFLSDLDNKIFKNRKDFVYEIYSNVTAKKDVLIFDLFNVEMKLFVLNSIFLGREFSKTFAYRICDNDLNKYKLSVLEVLYGVGYIVLESEDRKNIKVISVDEQSLVLVPKGYSFQLINTSQDENMVVSLFKSSNAILKKVDFSNTFGSTLFYIKSGFVRNKNVSPDYILENYQCDYLEDLNIDKSVGLYNSFINLPEKFKFLR